MSDNHQLETPKVDIGQLQELSNSGLKIVGKPSSAEEKTIVVLGMARGGTSAVSGALSKLGVFMGKTSGEPIFEDIHLASPIEANDPTKAGKIIEQYNSDYNTWGFKRPALIRYINSYHTTFRNPRYIIVFRDLLATANRAEISNQLDTAATLDNLLIDLQQLIHFIKEHNPYALLVSYEKLLQNPKEFVSQVIAFCNLKANPEQYQSAIEFISPSPRDYVESSRINRTRGRLDIVNNKHILGWAQYMSQRNKTPTISILVNEQEILQVKANNFRQDLLDMKISPDGCCAFELKTQQVTQLKLKPGDSVRAKVIDDIVDLSNSPQIYRKNNDGLVNKFKQLLSRFNEG